MAEKKPDLLDQHPELKALEDQLKRLVFQVHEPERDTTSSHFLIRLDNKISSGGMWIRPELAEILKAHRGNIEILFAALRSLLQQNKDLREEKGNLYYHIEIITSGGQVWRVDEEDGCEQRYEDYKNCYDHMMQWYKTWKEKIETTNFFRPLKEVRIVSSLQNVLYSINLQNVLHYIKMDDEEVI